MLQLYHATCSYDLEISDLVITDSLNVYSTVSHLNDANVSASYTTISTSVNEGTGFVSSVLAHTVGKVGVGLARFVCSAFGTRGQHVAEISW